MKCRPGIIPNTEFEKVPALRCTANALHRVGDTRSYCLTSMI